MATSRTGVLAEDASTAGGSLTRYFTKPASVTHSEHIQLESGSEGVARIHWYASMGSEYSKWWVNLCQKPTPRNKNLLANFRAGFISLQAALINRL